MTMKDFKILIFLFIVFCLYCVIGLVYQLFYIINPPETITENGYTYQLVADSEYDPPETIEKYGQTYVLIIDTSE